jgi:hypothetical protein
MWLFIEPYVLLNAWRHGADEQIGDVSETRTSTESVKTSQVELGSATAFDNKVTKDCEGQPPVTDIRSYICRPG